MRKLCWLIFSSLIMVAFPFVFLIPLGAIIKVYYTVADRGKSPPITKRNEKTQWQCRNHDDQKTHQQTRAQHKKNTPMKPKMQHQSGNLNRKSENTNQKRQQSRKCNQKTQPQIKKHNGRAYLGLLQVWGRCWCRCLFIMQNSKQCEE